MTPEVAAAGGFGKAAGEIDLRSSLQHFAVRRNKVFGNRRRRFPVVVCTRQLGDTNDSSHQNVFNSKSIEISFRYITIESICIGYFDIETFFLK